MVTSRAVASESNTADTINPTRCCIGWMDSMGTSLTKTDPNNSLYCAKISQCKIILPWQLQCITNTQNNSTYYTATTNTTIAYTCMNNMADCTVLVLRSYTLFFYKFRSLQSRKRVRLCGLWLYSRASITAQQNFVGRFKFLQHCSNKKVLQLLSLQGMIQIFMHLSGYCAKKCFGQALVCQKAVW